MELDVSLVLLLIFAGLVIYSLLSQRSSQIEARLTRIERQVAHLFQELDIAYEPSHLGEVSPEVLDRIRQGKKIEAIKALRAQTGIGLKEAKEQVEVLEAEYKAGGFQAKGLN